MPFLVGGSGSSNPVQQVPFNAGGTGQGGTVYTPSAQPQADTTYQALLNNLYGQYTSGATPPQQNFPLAENAALNIATNPFAGQQLQGAQDIAPFLQGAGVTAANQGQELQSLIPMLTGLGNTLSGYMPIVQGVAGQVQNYMQPTAALSPQVTAGIAPLQQGAANILQTGYDPQNALYTQLQQRALEQSAGANAMAGLGSSPYGAGLTADALNNLNINWENQQLQRQAQALQGAGQAYGQAGQLGTEGANIYGRAGQLGGEVGNLYGEAGRLGGEAANLYSQAPQIASSLLGLGTQGANAYMQGAGLPYSTSVAQSQAALPALTSATNLGISQYQLPQQVLNDLQSYLRLGQSASDLSGVLGNLGFNQGQQQLGNVGGLLGAGSNLAFGSGGLTGALGINPTTGLLGNGGLAGLFGGAGGAITDPLAGAGLADTFATGAAGFSPLDLGLLFA